MWPHHAVCGQFGVLGWRGFDALQLCREAGASVVTNVFVRDLDLGKFNGLYSRRHCGRPH